VLNILVIAPHPRAKEQAADLLPESLGRVTLKVDVASASGLLEHGLFDAILLLAPQASEHTLDEIRRLRRLSPDSPISVIASATTPLAWEESALASGADFVLREPLSPSHVAGMLKRSLATSTATRNGGSPHLPASSAPSPSVGRASLDILRDFSHILGYSLDYELFAEHFVQKVRQIVGVSRIAVYLERPPTAVASVEKNTRMSCVAAVGIPPDIVECFELSRTAGLGARMYQSPQIVTATGEALHNLAPTDQKIQREFEILGCRVAVPISDRTRTIGVALLGGHVTGRSFNAEELQLLYLLMEELGSAIKNTWLHRQLASSHRLLADVLATLSSGCLVVDHELTVLHANRAVVAFLKGPDATDNRLDFADLPPALATPLYDSVAKSVKVQPFFHTGGPGGEHLFRVSIVPFHAGSSALPRSAMLVLEDFTQIEAAKRFEIEASKAKLVALIAKRFAHEIRNSLVPLATHEQLLDSEYQHEDFRRSLKSALARETGRIQRFTEQMLYLSQPARTANEILNLRDLVEHCFERMNGMANHPARLHVQSDVELPLVRCHRPALEHAIQEIVTNALQAGGNEALVQVRIRLVGDETLQVAFRDNGPGFNEETVERATEPFFTTRNTGVGLGLTVARKVLEDHQGRLTVRVRSTGRDSDVEMELPLARSL
jgi:signal transduction histidine kinase